MEDLPSRKNYLEFFFMRAISHEAHYSKKVSYAWSRVTNESNHLTEPNKNMTRNKVFFIFYYKIKFTPTYNKYKKTHQRLEQKIGLS